MRKKATETIDFSQEIRDHVIWNVRLRCFLDGGECITEEKAVSPRECCLGKWLYTEGMEKYGTVPQIQELERIHAELHAIVKRVIRLKNSGNIRAAELELAELEPVNNEIIEIIMRAEEIIGIDRK